VNFGGQNVSGDAPVVFSLGGLVPNVGITPPDPNGTAFTILSEGDYEYIFYAVARGVDPAFAMQFAIFVNGVNQGAGHEFNSNRSDGGENDALLVRGQGIIHLVVGDVVTLVNRTGNGTIKLDLLSSTESNNATLSLKKLSV
jgi:hypothetical protein